MFKVGDEVIVMYSRKAQAGTVTAVDVERDKTGPLYRVAMTNVFIYNQTHPDKKRRLSVWKKHTDVYPSTSMIGTLFA